MTFLTKFLLLSFLVLQSQAAPTHGMKNITIEVPIGTSDHGDPHIICTPTHASDVLLFFVTNYFAHAGTIQASPGQPTMSLVLEMAVALLFPVSGCLKAMRAINRRAIFCKTPLATAVRAGAVCEVVRIMSWRPQPGETISMSLYERLDNPWATTHSDNTAVSGTATGHASRFRRPLDISAESPIRWGLECFLPAKGKNSMAGRRVYGKCDLPEGYALRLLPKDAPVTPGTEASLFALSTTSSFSQGFIAMLQLLFASYTLAKTDRNQLSRYGYAAYGLTVLPFLMMSFLNLLSSLLNPAYHYVYLIDSETLWEARLRGGSFEGMVGHLGEPAEAPSSFFVQFADAQIEGSIRVKPIDDRGKKAMDLMLGPLPDSGYTCDLADSGSIKALLTRQLWLTPGVASETQLRWQGVLALFLMWTPFAIVGVLSKFDSGASTVAERVFTMAWLICDLGGGITFAMVSYLQMFGSRGIAAAHPPFLHHLLKVTFGVYAVVFVCVVTFVELLMVLCAPLGGYAMVGKMFVEYGTCQALY